MLNENLVESKRVSIDDSAILVSPYCPYSINELSFDYLRKPIKNAITNGNRSIEIPSNIVFASDIVPGLELYNSDQIQSFSRVNGSLRYDNVPFEFRDSKLVAKINKDPTSKFITFPCLSHVTLTLSNIDQCAVYYSDKYVSVLREISNSLLSTYTIADLVADSSVIYDTTCQSLTWGKRSEYSSASCASLWALYNIYTLLKRFNLDPENILISDIQDPLIAGIVDTAMYAGQDIRHVDVPPRTSRFKNLMLTLINKSIMEIE